VLGGPSTAAAASGPLADLDLALARLTVGAELLGIEFYNEAIASKKMTGAELKYLQDALFNEQEHLASMSQILSGAGQTPSTADDFTFTFPDGTFESRESIAKFGAALESVFVGAYLGAVDQFTPPDLKTAAARIAANEAQHQTVFTELAGGHPIGASFPVALDYETVSDAISPYMS
jgi:rubrerythrin